MKFLTDFFPLVVFFITYQITKDIYSSTGVLIAATLLQVGFLWIKNRRVEKMHLITLIFVVILGGATIFLQDDNFIKWKPTVVNWLLGAAFLGSQFFGEKNFIQRMLEANIELPAPVWRTLNLAWVSFFIVAGASNIYVAYHFEQATWVNFKVFGLLGLTVIFVLAQGVYLSRYLTDTEKSESSSSEQ
ncbi:MAG: septation protein A [Hahellaceae bacterium]|nr:septation protein A [Hahellaceae bacterium]